MTLTSFLSPDELAALGGGIHPTALISRHARFYGVRRIQIGAESRIDDFCVLSAGEGGIVIGRSVHIGVGSTLIGQGAILLADFATLSGRVSIYTSSDDYSGAHMTNPTVPAKFTAVDERGVVIGQHAIVGCGAVVLPGVTIGEGAAIGALSLVNRDIAPWKIAAGQPAKVIKDRSKDLLQLAAALGAARASD